MSPVVLYISMTDHAARLGFVLRSFQLPPSPPLFEGYNTDEAGDGFEALKIAENTIFSAFFVDIQMPLMDGYELIENLRKSSIYNSTPVFVISGAHVDRENILSRLEDLNVSNFYEKPVDLEALITELDNKLSITTDNLKSGVEQ